MDNILEKNSEVNLRDLDQLKYDLNSTNSDSEEPHEDEDYSSISMKEDFVKQESKSYSMMCKMETDLILPEVPITADAAKSGKKREKSKKEMEEEEREKMQ